VSVIESSSPVQNPRPCHPWAGLIEPSPQYCFARVSPILPDRTSRGKPFGGGTRIRTPVTRYGPLHYYGSSERSNPWYLISFGDIERHRFSADWDSRKQAWTMVELDF
jgi:hypothetical protein